MNTSYFPRNLYNQRYTTTMKHYPLLLVTILVMFAHFLPCKGVGPRVYADSNAVPEQKQTSLPQLSLISNRLSWKKALGTLFLACVLLGTYGLYVQRSKKTRNIPITNPTPQELLPLGEPPPLPPPRSCGSSGCRCAKPGYDAMRSATLGLYFIVHEPRG